MSWIFFPQMHARTPARTPTQSKIHFKIKMSFTYLMLPPGLHHVSPLRHRWMNELPEGLTHLMIINALFKNATQEWMRVKSVQVCMWMSCSDLYQPPVSNRQNIMYYKMNMYNEIHTAATAQYTILITLTLCQNMWSEMYVLGGRYMKWTITCM